MQLRRNTILCWLVILGCAATATSGPTIALAQDDQQQRLKELKTLYDQKLIPKSIYEERVRQILNGTPQKKAPKPTVSTGHGSRAGSAQQPAKRDLAGIWSVRVEGLSIWAPHYTLDKTVGFLRWKLSLVGNRLILRQSAPNSEFIPISGSKGSPFEEVAIENISVTPDKIAFTIRGIMGAYESIRLERFTEHEIRGTYTVFDGHGGGTGSGPEYRGKLILEKQD